MSSFEGKTYMQLFQYLISKRSVSPPGPTHNCPWRCSFCHHKNSHELSNGESLDDPGP